MIRMHNPWGSSNWSGDYSVGTATYDALNAALLAQNGVGIIEEGGKFWINYDDFLEEFPDVDMAYSVESKTGGFE